MTFSALTFNMQNGQGWDDARPDDTEIKIADTVAFLKEQTADVIFLQEVERGHEGGGQVEPPPHYEILKAELAGYDSIFGYPISNPQEIPFGLGLAIFSRTLLSEPLRIDLPPADITFEYGGTPRKPSHRLLIGADTKIGGRTVRLLNTHLQAFFMINGSSNDHRDQRDLVEAKLRKSTGPTLLAGDFNCAPGESLIEQFASAGFQTAQNKEITWRRMPFVLDHLLHNSPLRLEECRVIPTATSDHHALRCEYSFA